MTTDTAESVEARHDVLLQAFGLVKEFPIAGTATLFRKAKRFTAVNDVTLEIYPRETLALVGESGSGKSTVARLIARLINTTSGSITFDGLDVTHLRRRALHEYRSRVQVIFQDPFSSLNPKHTVAQIVTAPLRYQERKIPGGATRFTQELLERVGLDPNWWDRYPSQFSGGQAQRIGIARALAVSPKLVICDEAVSALDVSVQAQVINLLRRLQREEGFSYLFIAHDLAVVRQIATRVAVMSQGRIVETGDRDAVFEQPQHDYTKTLLAAIPRIRPEWDAARRRNLELRRHETEAARAAHA